MSTAILTLSLLSEKNRIPFQILDKNTIRFSKLSNFLQGTNDGFNVFSGADLNYVSGTDN